MRRIVIICLFVYVAAGTAAQPFREEIDAFRKADSIRIPPRKANLFVGSSSIRLWNTLEEDFEGHRVINRGFGGSSLPDVIRYAGQIILPYKPAQVIIYCGENDLAASDTISAETVSLRFRQLFSMIRARYRKVPIAFISIKPSPSRAHLLPKMKEANRLIREFLATEKRTKYIDVFSLMLTPEGTPREELFVDDRLHMNAAGYAIWTREIKRIIK